MRLYAAGKAEKNKIVDRLWMDVARGRVSRRTARRVFIRRKAFSGGRDGSLIAGLFGKPFAESVVAAAAVGLCMIVALGFCNMRRSNDALVLRNEALASEKEHLINEKNSLSDDIDELSRTIDAYEKLSEEQKEQLREKEAAIIESREYIEELKEKHKDDIEAATAGERAKLQELADMLSELDIFGGVQSRSGNLYSATREITAAAETVREIFGDTGETDRIIANFENESAEIKYYRDHYPDFMPVNGLCMTSSYGWRRDPFTGEQKFHSGIDIACSTGSSVWASASGTVVEAGENGSYGLCILIDHGNGFKTRYAHLSRILVNVGDTVQKSDRIAYSGMTGRATGPHLHFEVILWGETQHPLNYIGD